MTRGAGFWRANRGLVLAFVLLLAFALFFAAGAMRRIEDRFAAADQPIEPWMTPRYVAHSWDLPREVMVGELGFAPGADAGQPLSAIARERGVPVEVLIVELEAAIAAHRADGR